MSEAKGKVEWCLKKARKELGSGEPHSGLVKIGPDRDLALGHLAKAEHNLQAFLHNKEGGFYDWTISIGFYVMYHCCLSIISKFGYESENQECTLAVIESLVEDGKVEKDFLKYVELIKSAEKKGEEQIIRLREKYQYTPIIEIDVKRVDELLGICQDMIKDTKGVIER